MHVLIKKSVYEMQILQQNKNYKLLMVIVQFILQKKLPGREPETYN